MPLSGTLGVQVNGKQIGILRWVVQPRSHKPSAFQSMHWGFFGLRDFVCTVDGLTLGANEAHRL